MPPKTLKNKKVVDYTRGVSREDRAIARRIKRESLSSSGSHRSRFDRHIQKMLKLQEIRKAVNAAFEAKYGSIDNPDRVALSSTFKEEPFGGDIDPQIIDLSSSMVSLALFDGDKMLFACSGIALPCGTTKLHLTRFVTSVRLVDEFNHNRNRDDKLRIEVRLPNNEVVDGFLGLYDKDIAIVTSFNLLDVCPVDLVRRAPSSHHDIIAAGRAFKSGNLMLTSGLLNEKECLVTLAHITKAGLGGPIISFNGKFLGVILHHETESRTKILPQMLLRERLRHFQILTRKTIHFRGYSLPSGVSSIVPSGFMKRINWLRAMGYPMPPPLVLELNGQLLNTFEEEFGDIRAWKGYPFGVSFSGCREYVWALLPREIITNISRRVVSLASFNGNVRFFACTGLLIKWPGGTRPVILTSASLVRTRDNPDKIDESLRIEVFLPPKQCVKGTLALYHSSYNIAIVSLEKGFCAVCPEDIFSRMEESSKKVVAIGRETDGGFLMASKGEVIDKPSKLRCKDLKLSTCKIKKAGIGGPLINFDGRFVGMNFYDGSGETPFLPRKEIVQVLSAGVVPPFSVDSVTDLPLESLHCPCPWSSADLGEMKAGGLCRSHIGIMVYLMWICMTYPGILEDVSSRRHDAVGVSSTVVFQRIWVLDRCYFVDWTKELCSR